MDTGFAEDPVEIRDGRIYFVMNGMDLDITELCSGETYYRYETVNENGVRNVVLVGGEPEDLGWAEFVWDENGAAIGSNATYGTETEPQWLTAGKAALGF